MLARHFSYFRTFSTFPQKKGKLKLCENLWIFLFLSSVTPVSVVGNEWITSHKESPYNATIIRTNSTSLPPESKQLEPFITPIKMDFSREFLSQREINRSVIQWKLRKRRGSSELLSPDGRKILNLLGLFELSETVGSERVKREAGLSELVAAEMALEDVNNARVLPGYKLVMITNDTQCDPGAGVDAFFHALYSRRNISARIVSVLGTACSEVTERVAKVATHQRILQVSFGSTSPSLSDRNEFPLFYRTVASVSSHAKAIIELITKFKWDTVSFLTENENRYTMPANHLVQELEEKGNINSYLTVSFSKAELEDQIKVLNNSDSRIIIASFGLEIAPRLFCAIRRIGLFGPDYVWIWIGKPDKSWWRRKSIIFPSKTRETRHIGIRNQMNATGKGINYTANPANYLEESGNLSAEAQIPRGRSERRVFPFKTESVKGKAKQREREDSLPCTFDELMEVVENTLVVDRVNVLDRGRVSDFGMTTDSFATRLREKLGQERGIEGDKDNDKAVGKSFKPGETGIDSGKRKHFSPSQFAPETYDAVWAIALGLKGVLGWNYSLENFNYKDNYFSYLLHKEVGRLQFTGVSGPFSFSGSDRVGITSFMQIQGGKLYQVGLYYPDEEFLDLDRNCTSSNGTQEIACGRLKWGRNMVPIARRKLHLKRVGIENSLYIFVVAVALLGILLATAFLLFNLYYRKLKYIKLSSPNLNNLVILGCIFAYIAVIILGWDLEASSISDEKDGSSISYICSLRAYLLSMAFSLAFGSMFAKTYRVHRIFTRSCIGVVKNKLLKDTQLIALVLVLMLLDVVIVTSWAIVDPMHRHLQNLTEMETAANRSVVYQLQIEVCHSTHGHAWLSVMYAYKSLLLVVGIYMAWETRHVKIPVLNDSKDIAYCVYIVVLTSVLAVSLANLVSDRVTLAFVSVSSLILTSTTVTLCVLFLPKIHTIKTGGHKGDPVVGSLGLKIEFNTRRFVVEDPKELMFRAEVQNRVYKRQIEAIDVEIWRLENMLQGSSHSSLASMEAGNRKSVRNSGTSLDKDDQGSTGSGEDASEIYTVYLHGPRFIVPISVLSFQNPKASFTPLSLNLLELSSQNEKLGQVETETEEKRRATLHPPGPPPRSSWPNVRSLLRPGNINNGILSKMRFKSEPKLLIEEASPVRNEEDQHQLFNFHSRSNFLTPKVKFEEPCSQSQPHSHSPSVTDDSFLGSKSNVSKSRKSSNTSCGSSGKRSSFLSMLRHPLAYFSGMVKVRAGEGEGAGSRPRYSYKGEEDSEYYEEEPQVFHLHVPERVRQFNSVPDLWEVRNSPVKKCSIMSDSKVLRLTGKGRGQGLSNSNPILQLTATSDESQL